MPTRALVARPCPDGGFEGRYVHSDGNPDFMVPVLIAARRSRFADDHDALAEHLLSHEAGWESLGEDLIRPTGDLAAMFHGLGDGTCFCHDFDGATSQPLITEAEIPDRADIEWVYVLRPDGLEVIDAHRDPDDPRGPLIPWDHDLQMPIPEWLLRRWRPTTPAPPRRTPPARTGTKPATATRADIVTRKPASR